MAEKHIVEVLTAAGLPADQFKALKELPDDAPDFKPETYTAPIRTAVETAVKNDPAFYEALTPEALAPLAPNLVKKIEAAQYGHAGDRHRTKILQGLGITRKDLKDVSDDDFKSPEGFAKAVLAHVTAGKVTDAEIQKALLAANEKLQKLEGEEIPNLQKKYQDEADTKVNTRTLELVSLSTLAQVQGLTTPAADLTPALIRELNARYDFKIDGFTIVPLQKGKALPAMNADKTKELSFDDAVSAIATERKWIAAKTTATTTSTGTTTVATDGNSGKLAMSSHISGKVAELAAAQAKE